MKRYIYIECDNLANRGYNKAVKVYKLRSNKFPLFVGSNYSIDSQSWFGYEKTARQIINAIDGHKLTITGFVSKNIELKGV